MGRKVRKHRTKTARASKPKKDGGSDASAIQGEFAEHVDGYLTRLADLRQRGASEDSIRDAFLQFLRNAFPRLEQAQSIELEKHIPALRVRGGFADALYGDLIFECKRRLDDASRAEGQEELTRYIRNQQHPERYLGILNDGETLEVYALRNGDLEKVDQITLSVDGADEAKLWLDCYLFHEKNLVPTANDVALRFGDRSPTFWHSLRVLGEMWREVGENPTAQTKFVEWQSLLSIVYGSAVGEESLFLRHTYLALFARSLAFAAIERQAPDAEQVSGIISGEAFRRIGFENFVGDDFFTWMTEANVFDQARGLLHSIATRLTAAYDLQAVREDLLKELYQELVDPQTRHDLGEFYTPDWLAELTLRKAGFPVNSPSRDREGAVGPPLADGRGSEMTTRVPSLFDPSCGSGTFLFTAVRLLRESGLQGKRLVDFCMEHLAGIDVHPLAVTIAKTNLLLALGDDLRGYQKRISLPIYMADTLAGEEPDTAHPEIEVKVEVDEIAKRSGKSKPRGLPAAFGIPSALADHPDRLHQAVDALLEYADPGLKQSDAEAGFRSRLEEIGIPERQRHQWDANLDLMRWLLEPPATNSVWRFILNNAYQPELLARRKFAFVVGNPPWLAYFFIQRRDYQERVRRLMVEYNLVNKRHLGLIGRIELASLFFAFCADRFLAEKGTLAFVMPRSVLTGAKQHAQFRTKYVAASKLLIDCEQVMPLFNVPACVLVFDKTHTDEPAARTRAAIPTLRLQAQFPNRNASLAEAQSYWKESAESFSPGTTEEGSPYWEFLVQGADILPRCFWFVCPPEEARVVDRKRPQLATNPAVDRKAKRPWKGIRLRGSVEAEFLYATLLSNDMLPFGYRRFSLIVLPVKNDKRRGLITITGEDAVRLGKTGLADWLRKAEREWSPRAKQSELVTSIYDRLDYLGKLTRQRPTGVAKLLYGSAGTHLCSCIVDAKKTDQLSVQRLPVQGFSADQTTYWLECHAENEAHYLCAVLNAPLVDEAIKPYQTKGAFGAQKGGGHRHIHRRPFEVLPIPRFDAKDKRHRQLAGLSEHCHEKVRQAVAQAHADGDERFFTTPIGRLRTQLRKDLLAEELADIDALVGEILKPS